MALKYGIKDISALKFDKPIEPGDTYSYDFANDWTINPAQTGGVVVTNDHTLTITKFKPNVWFIKSNYATMNKEQFLVKFYNIDWTLNGISANSAKLTRVQTSTYKPAGLVITPVNAQNTPMDPGAMNVAGGSFKNPNYGWSTYGYVVGNGTYKLYNYPAYNANYPQVALVLHSAVEPDGDGFITLDSPITISVPNLAGNIPVNPTSVEGFQGYLGDNQVYDKPMTFSNVLSAYSFVFKETGRYTESIQGVRHNIPNSWNGEDNVAFVVSCRGYNGIYNKIRLPEVIDFDDLIQQNFPFKIWGQFETVEGHSNIWDSIANAFSSTTITNDVFSNHLFANSSGGKLQDLDLNFDCYTEKEGGGIVEHYIDIYGIFDHCGGVARNIHFNINRGLIKSLVQAFRQLKNVDSVTFNKPISVTDWSGAFEGTTLQNFPNNIIPTHQWRNTGSTLDMRSETTCDMEYLANGSSLLRIGDYKDDTATTESDKYYTVRLTSNVRGFISRSAVQEIRYLLDMKFVDPTNNSTMTGGWDGNSPFSATSLTSARIKNLNLGNWNLDGNGRGGVVAGNIPNLDADSTNYMLNNMFDLRQNDTVTGDTGRFENQLNSFNNWTYSQGWDTVSIAPTCYVNNGTVTRNITNPGDGRMVIKPVLANCKLYVTINGSTREITDFPLDPIAGTREISGITGGNVTFKLEQIDTNYEMHGTLELGEDFHFRSELTPGFTASSIYLPAALQSKADPAAILEARARGWNVYFGGEPVSTRFTISENDSIDVDQTKQYGAYVETRVGDTVIGQEDVTSSVSWESNQTSVATITAAGLARPVGTSSSNREAVITGRYGSLSASSVLTVTRVWDTVFRLDASNITNTSPANYAVTVRVESTNGFSKTATLQASSSNNSPQGTIAVPNRYSGDTFDLVYSIPFNSGYWSGLTSISLGGPHISGFYVDSISSLNNQTKYYTIDRLLDMVELKISDIAASSTITSTTGVVFDFASTTTSYNSVTIIDLNKRIGVTGTESNKYYTFTYPNTYNSATSLDLCICGGILDSKKYKNFTIKGYTSDGQLAYDGPVENVIYDGGEPASTISMTIGQLDGSRWELYDKRA